MMRNVSRIGSNAFKEEEGSERDSSDDDRVFGAWVWSEDGCGRRMPLQNAH